MKVMTALLLGAVILLWYRTRRLFFSTLLVALLSLCLFSPNKYYYLEVISGSDMLEPAYRDGVSIGYGLSLANVFVGISSILLVKTLLKRHLVGKFCQSPWVKLLIICWLGFGIVTLITGQATPFPTLSLVWAAQYSQMYIVALCLFGARLIEGKKFSLVYIPLLATIFLQICVGFGQYALQSFVGLPIESGSGGYFASGLDENNAVFRVAGTYMFHNQFALLMIVLINSVFPVIMERKSGWGTLLLFLGSVATILSLSRSIWLAGIVCAIIWWCRYADKIRQLFLRTFSPRQFIVCMVILMAILSYAVIPRILLSANVLYDEAGGPIRGRLITEGLEALGDRLWLGYGLGTNETTLFNKFPDGVMRVFPVPIHMTFLQLALDIGVIGLGFFLLPYFILLRQSIVGSKKDLSFLTSAISFLIYWLFLPANGNVEFAYLGLIIGFGIIFQYNNAPYAEKK